MRLVAVAFLGKANEPLFFYSINDQPYGNEEANTHQLVFFSALDVLDERRKKALASAPSTFDLYLGQVLQMDDYKVFGHYSNTHTKTLVLCDSATDAGDASVREAVLSFRNMYTNAVQNPFLSVEKGPLDSNKLKRSIVDAFIANNRVS